MKRILALLAAAMLLLAGFPVMTSAAEQGETHVLRVAFPESKGINEVYDDGTYGGAVYDWLEEIAKYTGWKYEFISGDSSELLDGMINGEYDLMGGMFYLPGYEEYFNYPKYVMGSNYSLLIYRKGDDSIKGFDYNTLNGKKIGVLRKATSKIERLEKFLDFNKVQCELVYYDDQEGYGNCLDNGEVDVLLGSDVYMKDEYNVAAKISGDPYYIVTAVNEPELCKQLSDAMEAIYSANPNFAEELYNKYFPDKYINSIQYTDEEKAFLKQKKPLRVSVVKDRFPLVYEEDGSIAGMVPDCLKLISKRTGFEFTYVYADSYQNAIDLVKDGKADLMGGFLNEDASAEANGLVKNGRLCLPGFHCAEK